MKSNAQIEEINAQIEESMQQRRSYSSAVVVAAQSSVFDSE